MLPSGIKHLANAPLRTRVVAPGVYVVENAYKGDSRFLLAISSVCLRIGGSGPQ